MKTTRNLIVTGMLAAFCCSVASAQIIYSNSFSGGAVDINGTAPTYINPSAASFGGSLGAAFDVVSNNAAGGYAAYQDGTLGSGSESVLLPFTPQQGYIYTMSASLTFAIQPPGGGWGALGFGGNFPPSNGSASDPRFNQPLVNGQPWALLNYASQGGGAVLFNTRGHSVGNMANLMTSLNTAYNINFVLDTTGANWSTALYIDNTLVKDYTYTGSVAISSIGYGQTATTAGAYQWNTLSLSAEAVPEPSTLALTGAGFVAMFVVTRYRRRRFVAGKIAMD